MIYGELDTNFPTNASVERLSALDRANIQIMVYEGSGHAIEDPVGRGTRLFRLDALRDMVNFIEENGR